MREPWSVKVANMHPLVATVLDAWHSSWREREIEGGRARLHEWERDREGERERETEREAEREREREAERGRERKTEREKKALVSLALILYVCRSVCVALCKSN